MDALGQMVRERLAAVRRIQEQAERLCRAAEQLCQEGTQIRAVAKDVRALSREICPRPGRPRTRQAPSPSADGQES